MSCQLQGTVCQLPKQGPPKSWQVPDIGIPSILVSQILLPYLFPHPGCSDGRQRIKIICHALISYSGNIKVSRILDDVIQNYTGSYKKARRSRFRKAERFYFLKMNTIQTFEELTKVNNDYDHDYESFSPQKWVSIVTHLLLLRKIDPNIGNDCFFNWACAKGFEETVNLLLKYKTDLSEHTLNFALCSATQCGCS